MDFQLPGDHLQCHGAEHPARWPWLQWRGPWHEKVMHAGPMAWTGSQPSFPPPPPLPLQRQIILSEFPQRVSKESTSSHAGRFPEPECFFHA